MSDILSALDGLLNTSFDSLPFPSERTVLHSQGRQHVHEYPHTPGGAPEKLGRGLWNLTVSASFQNRFTQYPNLYPGTMTSLRRLYETQTTSTFVHPTAGKFQAFITSWRQVWDPKLRSGEKVDIEFLEDQRSLFLTTTADATGSSEIAITQAQLDAELKIVQAQMDVSASDLSVFDALRANVNAVLAIKDTVGLYSSLLSDKANELVSLCSQVDQLPSLQTAVGLGVLDQLRSLWSKALSLSNQIASGSSPSEWTVPQTMSLMDVAIRLYGDASRQQDLMGLNASRVPDAYRVPAGTDILYFPDPTGSVTATSSQVARS